MPAGSILFSSTKRRTAGPERLARSGAGVAGAAAGAFGAAAFGGGAAGADLLSALAAGLALPLPSAMRPSTPPTATLPSFGTSTSANVPAAGALTSSVTLSVSSSTSGSSTATASPGCLSQRATVASVTDSPSGGTMMSVAMTLLRSGRERFVDQPRLFSGVALQQAGRGGCRLGTADVARALRLDVERA